MKSAAVSFVHIKLGKQLDSLLNITGKVLRHHVLEATERAYGLLGVNVGHVTAEVAQWRSTIVSENVIFERLSWKS